VFTLHGAVMTFLFIIPGIPAALGNFILPIMLGAKDVAFPRLNLRASTSGRGLALLLLSIVLGGRHRLDLLHALLDRRPPRSSRSRSACSSSASARSSPA
jgi:hypothetical protein